MSDNYLFQRRRETLGLDALCAHWPDLLFPVLSEPYIEELLEELRQIVRAKVEARAERDRLRVELLLEEENRVVLANGRARKPWHFIFQREIYLDPVTCVLFACFVVDVLAFLLAIIQRTGE
jgi:hypothetical protein